MGQLFTNNATSTLAAGVTAAATSLTLATGDGAKFPNPSTGDDFLLTVFQRTGTTEANWEIMRVTARAGDVLTVVRGHEGTTPRAFSSGDFAELRLTAGAVQPMRGGAVSGAFNEALPLTVAGSTAMALGTAKANTISITGSAVITTFDATAAGAIRRTLFAGASTLTHNLTSMVLIAGANIVTASGDAAEWISLGGGNWQMLSYTRANGDSLGVVSLAKGGTGATSAGAALSNLGLSQVENKTSATIRSEITSNNVTTALGFTPISAAGNAATATLAANASLLGGLPVGLGTGGAWGFIPRVHTDGTMDIGRYVDFHGTTADGIDYKTRLDTGSGAAGDMYINGLQMVVNNTGTWSISVNGNAATATTATSANHLNATANYIWTAAMLPASFNLGHQCSFVQGVDGWTSYGSVITTKTYSGGGGSLQMYVPYSPTSGGVGLQVRFGNYDVSNGNAWTAWKTLLASDNYNTWVPTKLGGGASGLWDINVTGNAGTATSATWAASAVIATKLDLGAGGASSWQWAGQSGQPAWLWGGNAAHTQQVYNPSNFSVQSANILTSTRTNYRGVTDPCVVGELMWKKYGNGHTVIDASEGTAPNGAAINTTNPTNVWAPGYPTLVGWNGSATYGVRVDSARTANTVDGYIPAFAATANTVAVRDASGNLTAVLYSGSGGGLTGTASSLTAGNAASISSATAGTYAWNGVNDFVSTFNTSTAGPVSSLRVTSSGGNGAGMSFHRGGVYAINMGLDSDSVFRIGGWSAPANLLQLNMSGDLTTIGNITAYSDERLKTNWRALPFDFLEQIATVKRGRYDRTDIEATHVGAGAQSLQKIVPEWVKADADGTLSVDYGMAGAVTAFECAEELVGLRSQLKLQADLIKLLMEKVGY